MSETSAVRRHYEMQPGNEDLVSKVTRIIGNFEGPVTSSQLAGIDQFHVRGLAATMELASLARIEPGARILDAGSGLGGPSRYLAENFDCHVTGIDLTPSFVMAAQILADRAGLANRIAYETGDLCDLPFGPAQFDVIYTQHVVMNIRDRLQVYREMRRTLKPGGKFLFYDVLAADQKPAPYYPLPWAETAETSFLLNEAETRTVLEQAGLGVELWRDETPSAIGWFARQKPPADPGLTLAAVMGERFAGMTSNLAKSLVEGQLRLVMACCRTELSYRT